MICKVFLFFGQRGLCYLFSGLFDLTGAFGVDLRFALFGCDRCHPRFRSWSSAAPQFNLDVLPEAFAAAGIACRHLLALGGRRHRSKSVMPSSNTLWRNSSFQNYADYAATNAFRDGLKELAALARQRLTCACTLVAAIGIHEARRLRSIRFQIMGVKISCIARGILLPGQTIVFARDMKEFGIIDMR